MEKLHLEQLYNFRDFGGYETTDGRRLKKGVLYRSDELSHLTKKDRQTLQKLNIKTVIDYRSLKERYGNENKDFGQKKTFYLTPIADIAALASAEYGEIDMEDQSKLTPDLVEFLMIKQNQTFVTDPHCKMVYKSMIEIYLNPDNGKIVQHCRGGKDRTGYGVALLQGLLGVAKKDILKDYLLTNLYKKEKNQQSLEKIQEETGNSSLVKAISYFKKADTRFLGAALNYIEEYYQSIENYAKRELSITEKHIQYLKERYLESNEKDKNE
ncbi:tyrosine-protein phosphatase [Lactococcus ileimucosae]|uniref:Tyrosine-protein phosphatase n=1 Tax=Lactococcus ileimucosae TaxID=2941329 RepID=A0ABV4D498_9LACT